MIVRSIADVAERRVYGVGGFPGGETRRRPAVSRRAAEQTQGLLGTRRLSIWAVSLLLLIAALPPPAAAVDLESVLGHMDHASDGFRAMQAQLRWVKYTAIVEDESVDEGVIKVLRNKKGQINLLIAFQNPYPYFVSVRGTKVEIYRPRVATVEEYDVSKSKDTLEQALLLGFGTAGRYLREHYHLKLEGEEDAAGEATVKIELIPKSEKMLKSVPRLEMWISKTQWQPVQQKLYGPNPGDYRLYTYTSVALNPPLKESSLRLKIPRGVKRIFPQR